MKYNGHRITRRCDKTNRANGGHDYLDWEKLFRWERLGGKFEGVGWLIEKIIIELTYIVKLKMTQW